MHENEFEKALIRKQKMVESLVYVPCMLLPGLIAVPISEIQNGGEKQCQKVPEAETN